MRNERTRFNRLEYDDEFGLPASRSDFQPLGEDTNSAEDVIGEMGLVLIVILGLVVAVNLMLTALHIG